ncbi:MAG: hypothetical protein ABI432_14170 [Flavobacteriales bacterium]
MPGILGATAVSPASLYFRASLAEALAWAITFRKADMFENLSDKLERAFKVLKGQGQITEINVA